MSPKPVIDKSGEFFPIYKLLSILIHLLNSLTIRSISSTIVLVIWHYLFQLFFLRFWHASYMLHFINPFLTGCSFNFGSKPERISSTMTCEPVSAPSKCLKRIHQNFHTIPFQESLFRLVVMPFHAAVTFSFFLLQRLWWIHAIWSSEKGVYEIKMFASFLLALLSLGIKFQDMTENLTEKRHYPISDGPFKNQVKQKRV